MERKGARKKNLIPKSILIQLNKGEIESANLVEWLSVDQEILLKNVLNELDLEHYYSAILQNRNYLKTQSTVKKTKLIAEGIAALMNEIKNEDMLSYLKTHSSDTVRSWACYIMANKEYSNLEERLNNIKDFATDSHYRLKEISWIATRPYIAKDIVLSIKILKNWAKSKDPNIRRFASESTRPRGVWCSHITKLKEDPAIALPILDPLKSDPSRYVQNSVGNWLNDASKSQESFVIACTNDWLEKSPSSETLYIVNRALRTIRKKQKK